MTNNYFRNLLLFQLTQKIMFLDYEKFKSSGLFKESEMAYNLKWRRKWHEVLLLANSTLKQNVEV